MEHHRIQIMRIFKFFNFNFFWWSRMTTIGYFMFLSCHVEFLDYSWNLLKKYFLMWIQVRVHIESKVYNHLLHIVFKPEIPFIFTEKKCQKKVKLDPSNGNYFKSNFITINVSLKKDISWYHRFSNMRLAAWKSFNQKCVFWWFFHFM